MNYFLTRTRPKRRGSFLWRNKNLFIIIKEKIIIKERQKCSGEEFPKHGTEEGRKGRKTFPENMDLSAEITKMNLYKVFEPYIAKDVTMQERMKGNVRLTEGAPEEARQALSKWKAMKMKGLLF